MLTRRPLRSYIINCHRQLSPLFSPLPISQHFPRTDTTNAAVNNAAALNAVDQKSLGSAHNFCLQLEPVQRYKQTVPNAAVHETASFWPWPRVMNSPCDYPTCVRTVFYLPSNPWHTLLFHYSIAYIIHSTCHCNEDCKSATCLSCVGGGSATPRARFGGVVCLYRLQL